MNTNSGEKRKESGNVGESSDGTGKTRRQMSNSEPVTSPGLRAPKDPVRGTLCGPLEITSFCIRVRHVSPPPPFSLANVSTRIYL